LEKPGSYQFLKAHEAKVAKEAKEAKEAKSRKLEC
jgi:hypothetical protein